MAVASETFMPRQRLQCPGDDDLYVSKQSISLTLWVSDSPKQPVCTLDVGLTGDITLILVLTLITQAEGRSSNFQHAQLILILFQLSYSFKVPLPASIIQSLIQPNNVPVHYIIPVSNRLRRYTGFVETL